MVDEVTDSAENKVSSDALDRARLARERRDAEQKKRLDELRAHAAAAQAQRERRDEDRRRRQAEQRARDDDRRVQVEERKRAIWEASVSRREALIQREREREERLERSRASRSGSRSAFAFGSSTPRLLEPVDTTGFFWAARRAASTTNVMYASAPLTRGTSALQLDLSDGDHTKDETDRSPQPMWSSVARRRTDLVPTLPLSRAPGRAYSMTRLDRLSPRPLHAHSPSMLHLNRTKHEARSGDSTPVSRPGSALSSANTSVVRRNVPTPRRPRPNSIAGTGVNTPKGGILDPSGQSLASTPCVSRDASSGNFSSEKKPTRKTRPLSAHVNTPKFMTLSTTPSDGKPPLHRKPKLPKEHDKSSRSNKSKSVSPGRSTHSPTPVATKENSEHKDVHAKRSSSTDKRQVCPTEVTQKLEALQIQNEDLEQVSHKVIETVTIEKREVNEAKPNENISVVNNKPEIVHAQEKKEKIEEKREKVDEKKENGEESEMTASMYARRITTEEEAKAALAERRRKAREEFERQAEIERLRQEQEAKLAAEALALQQERERKEEEEAQELANRRRREDEEKLRKAIEAQQQLEREEAERKAREEADRIAKMKEEEEKRRIAEEENRLKRLEAEKEERERLLRKQRVEAIMARTRLKKAEEDKKQQEKPQASSENQSDNSKEVSPSSEQNNKQKENGNTADLLGINCDNSVDLNGKSTSSELSSESNKTMNNGNFEDLLGLSDTNNATDKPTEAKIIEKEDSNKTESNGTHNVGHITAGFIQTEKMAEEINQQKLTNAFEDDFTSHNGHSNINHPLMQNAI